jgi:acid phosphatase
VAGVLLLAGCSSGGGSDAATGTDSDAAAGTSPSAQTETAAAPSSGADAGLPAPDHVMVVVFENKDASAISAADAPYLSSLAKQGAALNSSHGVAHPSQPNYLALFSGSTQGVTGDSCPHTFSGDSLGSQLLAAGRTFVGYSEDVPSVGYTGCSDGDYARKHNPWVNFSSLPASVNQPLTALPDDYSKLPTVSFVVPNMCNDMHDCSVRTGDSWARDHLDSYVSWAQAHNSLLVVTFDEDEGSRENGIATFLVGPMVHPGTSDQYVDHYGMLRTLEAMYALAPLGKAADEKPLSGIWRTAGG